MAQMTAPTPGLTLTDLLGQLRLHAAQAADALAAEPVPASPPKTRRSKR